MTGIRRVGTGWTDVGQGQGSGLAEYVVRPGDTLARIARRLGVSLEALLRANPQIRDPDRIFPGQVLRIPEGRPKTSDPPATFSQGWPRDTYERAPHQSLFGTVPTLEAARRAVWPPVEVHDTINASAVFGEALRIVLGSEGGYSNDPHDPGGPTNRGITQMTYDAWRRKHGDFSYKDVRHITLEEVRAIYWGEYWKAARCDSLPVPLNVVVFDIAVNSGVGTARRLLQEALGIPVTGRWEESLGALQQADVRVVTESLLNLRERHYRQQVLKEPAKQRFLQG